MNRGEKVSRGFIIPCGNGAKLLQPTEEVLDQVARFVELLVVVALRFAAGFWRNHSAFASCGKRLKHALISIKGPIGDYGIGFDRRKKGIGTIQIVGLARREMEAGWVAQRIDCGVDFGAQSAS